MTQFGLREAAEQARTSKSSIWRAIKSGRLSATKTDGGDYSIDAAELFRAFPPRSETETVEQPLGRATRQTVTGSEMDDSDDEMALRVRLAALDAQIVGLKALLTERDRVLDEVRANREELRQDRDEWRARAERLLAPPQPAPASAPQPIPVPANQRRPWWRRLAG